MIPSDDPKSPKLNVGPLLSANVFDSASVKVSTSEGSVIFTLPLVLYLYRVINRISYS